MIKAFACDMMGLFQSKRYKIVSLIEGDMVTLQKMRPSQNRVLLMVCLNLMFCLDFTSCLFNQRDVITVIAPEHSCPALMRKQGTFKVP